MEENKRVKEASEELEYLTGDEAIRRKAFLREKALKDYVTNMDGAREEGLEKGEKIGKEKGKQQEKMEIAKKMLKEKMPKDVIIKITGLKEEEIEELAKEDKRKNIKELFKDYKEDYKPEEIE